MKTRYLFIVLFFLISCVVSAQTNGKSLVERVYLQTDKDMYLSGELVWLKLMTSTPDGMPLDFSKIAYVELLDVDASKAQLKIELSQGVGNSSLIIPTNLPTGYYRLVAYTRYMRNEIPVALFEKVIGIINPLVQKDTSTLSGDTIIGEFGSVYTISAKNQSSYQTRSLVEVNLDQLPANIHSLSISVASTDFTSPYPVSNPVKWHRAIKAKPVNSFSDKFLAEYEGHIVTGKLIDNSTGEVGTYNEILTPFIAFPGENIRLFSGKLAEDGNITFFTKHIGGSREIVSSLSGNLADNYRVDVESPFIIKHDEKELSHLDISTMDKDQLQQRSMGVQVLYSYMNDSLNRIEPVGNLFRSIPDKTYVMEEYTKFATMQEVITEFITFVRFRTLYGQRYLSIFREDIGYSQGSTLVMLDGIPLFNHEIIFKYNPLNIKKIETYFDRFIFGGKWYDGIMNFTTHNHNYPDLKPDPSTRFFSYDGTPPQRQFYSPVYSTEADRQSRLPDFRHTLYWDPDVKTNGKKSISIPFYTSDLTGDYKITVEGLTDDGKPIYALSRFRVE